MILVLDYETDGIEARPDYPPTPRGLAWLAIRGNEAPERGTYFAWGHPTENNTRECYAKDVCQRLMTEASRIIMHNAPFDASVLIEKWGFDVDWSKVEDTMVMAFLDNPHGELSLKPLAHACLGLPPAERDAVKDWLVRNHVCQDNSKWGAHICKAPGDLVGQYAIGDVVRTYQLFGHYQNKFEDYPGLKRAYAREMALMPHILKMDQRGVYIDIPSLEQDLNVYYRELEWLDERICEIIGPVDVDSNEEVANGIERAGLSSGFGLTPKGKRSVAKESLIGAVTHPMLLGHLLVRNSLATCIRTFMQPWLSQARRTGGKLFIKWNQVRNYTDTGARTGRLSSSPNLQNIPSEWEKLKAQLQAIGYELHMPMPQVRKYIVAKPGHKLISRDYCLHPDTEFLTDKGWKQFDDITNESLAYWDAGIIGFEQPIRRIEQQFGGQLIHVAGRKSFDVLATPEHRMVMLPRSGKMQPYKVALKDAPIGGKIYGQIPQAGICNNVEAFTEARQILIAAYQADGSLKHNSRVHFKFSKQRKIDRLASCLDILGIKYKIKLYRYEYDNSEFTWFILDLPIWVFDYVVGKEKLFTLKALTLPSEFLTELTFWDGCNAQYFTSQKHNADIMQALATLRGRASTLTPRIGSGFSTNTVWILSLHDGPNSYTKTQSKVLVDYIGRVVCFEMPHGTLITRRNGRVCVVGNCAQEMRLLAHFVGGVLLETLQKNPTTDVHLIAANIAGITRKVAKTMGFAILYGAGVGRIAETLGCSVAEAAVYKDAYLAAMPEIAALQKDLNQRGRNGEAINTLGGRMYYCENAKLVQGRYRTFEYKLTNYLIQGSAGDQTKQAMLDYAQSTIEGRIILSVHDEIVIECPEDTVEIEDALLRNCMEESFSDILECPFVTSGAVGDRFSEL